MAIQNLGMFPLADPYGQNIQTTNPYAPVAPSGRYIGSSTTQQADPGRDPCPNPCPPGWRHNPLPCGPCEEIDPNVEPGGDPAGDLDPDRNIAAACEPPAGGCPPGKIWQQSTCDCVAGQLGGPSRAPRDVQRSVPSMNIGVGGARGSLGGVEYGAFNRAGGGLGGGAMSDLALYENPMLAMGSEYLGKNVSAFKKGGRMRSPYYDNGGRWQEIARAMNGIIGLGQATNVMKGARPRRRFVKGGRF